MTVRDLDSTVAATRALGHPARLRAVAALRTGELCVCQITEVLKLAPSTVSAHLKELRRAGLVVERKDGKWVFFGLAADDATRALVDASLAPLAHDPQIAEDAALVGEIRRLPVEDFCRLGLAEARALHTTRPPATP